MDLKRSRSIFSLIVSIMLIVLLANSNPSSFAVLLVRAVNSTLAPPIGASNPKGNITKWLSEDQVKNAIPKVVEALDVLVTKNPKLKEPLANASSVLDHISGDGEKIAQFVETLNVELNKRVIKKRNVRLSNNDKVDALTIVLRDLNIPETGRVANVFREALDTPLSELPIILQKAATFFNEEFPIENYGFVHLIKWGLFGKGSVFGSTLSDQYMIVVPRPLMRKGVDCGIGSQYAAEDLTDVYKIPASDISEITLMIPMSGISRGTIQHVILSVESGAGKYLLGFTPYDEWMLHQTRIVKASEARLNPASLMMSTEIKGNIPKTQFSWMGLSHSGEIFLRRMDQISNTMQGHQVNTHTFKIWTTNSQ